MKYEFGSFTDGMKHKDGRNRRSKYRGMFDAFMAQSAPEMRYVCAEGEDVEHARIALLRYAGRMGFPIHTTRIGNDIIVYKKVQRSGIEEN